MFDSIKKLFKAKEVIAPQANKDIINSFRIEKETPKKTCSICNIRDFCKMEKSNYLCSYIQIQNGYDKNKPSILILDDNSNIISVLEDDIDDLHSAGKLNTNDYNIITFSTQDAVFNLQATLKTYDGLNIKFAILDITIGGGVYTEEKGNIILDGIDALISILVYNPDVKFIFFTGNKLNPYITKNKNKIEKFNKATGLDIFEHIIYKTTLTIEGRRDFLLKFLNNT